MKYSALIAAAVLMASCQSNDEENFASKAYIDSRTMTSETIIKGDMSLTKTLVIATPRPAEKQIDANFRVDPSLVDLYNRQFDANAVALPDTCYKLDKGDVAIQEGSVKSDEGSISFFKLGNLDRNLVYVLPVTVFTKDIELLSSAKTFYYVFRAGALINVVAEMYNLGEKKPTYVEINWKTPDLVRNMHQVTMEALVYVREYDHMITSIMGIEGNFLMRIGDADRDPSQLQIACRNNFPDPSADKKLPAKQWMHLAMTYNSDTQDMIIYVNGVVQSQGKVSNGPVTLVGNGSDRNFLIGKSYDNARWINGYISEVRLWNVVRTKDEIANSIYTVDPTSAGLVGYWKFDDMTGTTVHDYTGNGNDGIVPDGVQQLGWMNVSLPEKQ